MGAQFLVSTWQQETPGLYLTDNIPGFQQKGAFFFFGSETIEVTLSLGLCWVAVFFLLEESDRGWQ